MRAREVFMESLVGNGVELIFGNPGTTESGVVDSLFDHPELRYILALHEGVALGAANFYALAGGRTAVVNLHAAPGLGNAIGMLYGAARAGAPMVVTAGQPDSRLRLNEPILGHDLVAMAAPVTKWSVQVERADEMAPVMRRAFKIAGDPPRGPVFVALPLDVMEAETAVAVDGAGAARARPQPDPAAVAEIVGLIRASRSPVIVAGDDIAHAGAQDRLARLAETIGAPVWFEPLRSTVPAATSAPTVRGSLPVDGVATRKLLADADLVLLIGGRFFEELWYLPDRPVPAGAKVVEIEESAARLGFGLSPDIGLVADLGETVAALEQGLAGALDQGFRSAASARVSAIAAEKARIAEEQAARIAQPAASEGILAPHAMAELRAALPDDAIVVDESITTRVDLARTLDFGPGGNFGGRGGGIGQGLAGAIGVQLAHPDRKVVAVSGDGSAMYSIQALWTAAHHDLPVVFLILANREYRVLKRNLDIYRRNFGIATNRPYLHMDLVEPVLDFVALAHGMGVAGVRVDRAGALAPALEAAFASGRPALVEAVLAV